jgi:multidrug resistance efflux pump
MRLTKRSRIDTLQNEIRRRGNPWDRAIYFGLVAVFLAWIFDAFLGDYFYLRADGLVLKDRVVVATQFTAQVQDLEVAEGIEVKRGQPVVRLKSQEVEETLAKLSSDIANATGKRTAFGVRQNVISAVRASAEKSREAAHANTLRTRQLVSQDLISSKRVAELMESEFRTSQTVAEMEAEAAGISRDLPQLDATIREASETREQLKASYDDGNIRAPVDGIVGSLPVRSGSVARGGEPLMEIFTGEPFVVAYVPEGALYELQIGEPVTIKVGLKSYTGRISRVFPLSGQLPKAFQDTIRAPARAQVFHIAFDPGQPVPTLFAKPKIASTNWLPHWLTNLLGNRSGALADAPTSGDAGRGRG